MIILLKDLTWNCKIDYPKITGMPVFGFIPEVFEHSYQKLHEELPVHPAAGPEGEGEDSCWKAAPANLPIWP